MSLNEKQRRFAAEYLIDLNAKQAAIRAGYSPKTAESQGSRLLSNAKVAKAIQAGKEARAARTEITQDRVLQELARLAFFDIRQLYHEDGRLKAPHELDDDTAAAVAQLESIEEYAGRGEDREAIGTTKKAKTFSKDAALALAMRHLGMLNDKLTITRPRVVRRDLTGRKSGGEA
ncbi:terminase small subunit [Achromobacter insolitus]|uniref:terminase small subunit n=1 Tax=Achromobacter insolitus TaxID=217204 RepID=UPI0020A51420|nr:terminase small subunit [Achromobacter insolitus]MCP1404437.1 phage terminase small subunit [Achromobacter insolitus]